MEIPPALQSVNRLVSGVHAITRGAMPVEVQIGRVISPPPELRVAVNNIVLDKEQLYIDAFLLKGYERQARGLLKVPKAQGRVEMDGVKGSIRTNTQPKMGGSDKPSFVPHIHKVRAGYRADAKANYKADITGEYSANVIWTDNGLKAGDLVMLVPIRAAQQFIITNKIYYAAELEADKNGEFRPRN